MACRGKQFVISFPTKVDDYRYKESPFNIPTLAFAKARMPQTHVVCVWPTEL